jgi:putative ABC transport system permease protein
VTESLTLSAIGGVAAVAVAGAVHAGLVRMLAASDDRFAMRFNLDLLVVVFIAGVTVVAALFFGALPAWQLTKTDAAATLKEQSRGAVRSPGQLRTGRLLVGLQLALSVPLLVGAGLLARTVYNLQHADLGFVAERLLLVRVDLREAGPSLDRVRSEVLEAIRRTPGVGAASFSQLGLFSGGESATGIQVEGFTPAGPDDRASARDIVGPGYFSALGIRMRLGRDVEDRDGRQAVTVCVINEAFARRFVGGRNPIGLRLTTGSEGEAQETYEIVGVARDAHTLALRGEVSPRYFVPAGPRPPAAETPTFLIRATGEAAPLLATVRETVSRAAPGMPVLLASSLADEMAPLVAQDRAIAQIATVFGGVALALVAIGLYGLLAYAVVRRTGEIAIRIALGARAQMVTWMILRETVGLVALGLAVGGALAFGASRVIDSRLYGVAPQDPLTLVTATSVLLVVALTAAYIPARRASKLDPMTALR